MKLKCDIHGEIKTQPNVNGFVFCPVCATGVLGYTYLRPAIRYVELTGVQEVIEASRPCYVAGHEVRAWDDPTELCTGHWCKQCAVRWVCNVTLK